MDHPRLLDLLLHLTGLKAMFLSLMMIFAFLGIPALVRPSTFTKVNAQQVCSSSSCSVSDRIKMSATALPKSYEHLTSLYKDISSLSEILGLLSWDEQVMMPSGASESRGKQKAVLSSIIHSKSTSDELKQAITNANTDKINLNPYEQANVRDIQRQYQHSINVPSELEREIAIHESECVQQWVTARKNNDFNSFAPTLNKMFTLSKQKAISMNPDNADNVYDTMIDVFERGMSSDRLKEIFDGIEKPLKKILDQALNDKKNCKKIIHPALLGGAEWTIEKQESLCDEISKILGYDFSKGRLDKSVHPFTGGAGPQDVRITTRYSENIPFEGITSVIHELGHAFYEQGRNEKYLNLPVSEALSMGVHESQSLFWERMIGLNINFCKFILPILHKHLPHTKEQNVSADDLWFALNQVKPDYIRVEADELTYPFHIIIRFELERKIMCDNNFDIMDLPKIWNESMHRYLGVQVDQDDKGCLQDIHWPSGAVGYFPSYSLGAMMAAQLFRFLKMEVFTDIDDIIRRGEYDTIRLWLKENIHEKGSLYTSMDELLENVTGHPLNPKYFIEYLDEKFSKVYAN